MSSSVGLALPADPVTDYARDVVSGRVLAGPHVRDACARHLRDLEEGPARGLVWDPEAVERAVRFFRTVLRLNGGEHEGLPFVLLPWQQFVVGSILGWKDQEGFRRFRVAYIETAKGSGKSPLVAGLGIYLMVADGEPRAEIYAAATKKDQAQILFRDAVAMVDQSPALSSRMTKSGRNPVWNLAHMESGSFFRPISSDDAQSGPRPHAALLDEVHEHRNGSMVQMMRAGTKGRRQALILMITNSGTDRKSVCWEYHDYAAKVGAGDLEDDAFFGYVCGVDEGEDPIHDEADPALGYPASWAKSNPSLGHTIRPQYLEEQVREARGMPSKESTVRRLNFCQWTDAESPWISGELWRSSEVDPEEWVDPPGPSYLALDLSSRVDLCAMAQVWPAAGMWRSRVYFWTPRDTMLHRSAVDSAPYDAWDRDGYLQAVPGRSIEYGHVARQIARIHATGGVLGLAFDPWRIADLQTALDQEGVDWWELGEERGWRGSGVCMVRHGQGFGGGASEHALWMPRSVDVTMDAVLHGRLRVLRNPVLTWNSSAAVLLEDAGGNKKWEKRKSTGRIDGMVALSMALGLAHRMESEEAPATAYETRGLRTL
jgi:phage terminase large subunit-like protein